MVWMVRLQWGFFLSITRDGGSGRREHVLGRWRWNDSVAAYGSRLTTLFSTVEEGRHIDIVLRPQVLYY